MRYLYIYNDSILKLVNSDQISAIMLVDYFGYQQKENISLERAYNIIKKPITTEKSTNLQQYNQYSHSRL